MFVFNDTATTEIYTLSLHDALPIFKKSAGTGTTSVVFTFNNTGAMQVQSGTVGLSAGGTSSGSFTVASGSLLDFAGRSDEHTSDLQSPDPLLCPLLLEPTKQSGVSP